MVSIPTSAVDWPRTERYGASARYQHYVVIRGDEGFDQVTAAAARVLNGVAASTEPARALAMAMWAHSLLQGMLSAAELAARPAERGSLLESALWLFKETGATIPQSEVKRLARSI
jgi:hypothetical protein